MGDDAGQQEQERHLEGRCRRLDLHGHRRRLISEPVKLSETRSYEAFCAGSSFSSLSSSGSLIQATVGSSGGSGLRWRNLAGLAT